MSLVDEITVRREQADGIARFVELEARMEIAQAGTVLLWLPVSPHQEKPSGRDHVATRHGKLKGLGEIDVLMTVDGTATNTVKIAIK